MAMIAYRYLKNAQFRAQSGDCVKRLGNLEIAAQFQNSENADS